MQRLPRSRAQIEALILAEARSSPGGACVVGFRFTPSPGGKDSPGFALDFKGGSEEEHFNMVQTVAEMIWQLFRIYEMRTFMLH